MSKDQQEESTTPKVSASTFDKGKKNSYGKKGKVELDENKEPIFKPGYYIPKFTLNENRVAGAHHVFTFRDEGYLEVSDNMANINMTDAWALNPGRLELPALKEIYRRLTHFLLAKKLYFTMVEPQNSLYGGVHSLLKTTDLHVPGSLFNLCDAAGAFRHNGGTYSVRNLGIEIETQSVKAVGTPGQNGIPVDVRRDVKYLNMDRHNPTWKDDLRDYFVYKVNRYVKKQRLEAQILVNGHQFIIPVPEVTDQVLPETFVNDWLPSIQAVEQGFQWPGHIADSYLSIAMLDAHRGDQQWRIAGQQPEMVLRAGVCLIDWPKPLKNALTSEFCEGFINRYSKLVGATFVIEHVKGMQSLGSVSQIMSRTGESQYGYTPFKISAGEMVIGYITQEGDAEVEFDQDQIMFQGGGVSGRHVAAMYARETSINKT